jgi:hypothetical protein
VLSDRDRTILAPHLDSLRAARAQLESAQRELRAADRTLGEARAGTDWRDRLLGGLLGGLLSGLVSQDEDRSHRYRQARRERAAAARAVSAGEQRIARLAGRTTKLVEPILSRNDQTYKALRAAVRECDDALRECRSMARFLEAALGSLSSAAREPDTAGKRRYTEMVARAQRAAPGLRRAIDTAMGSVDLATGQHPSKPVRLEVTVLRKLPDGVAAYRPLRTLRSQVAAAATRLSRQRARAESARKTALTEAADALL